jgi:hypothetical protein
MTQILKVSKSNCVLVFVCLFVLLYNLRFACSLAKMATLNARVRREWRQLLVKTTSLIDTNQVRCR